MTLNTLQSLALAAAILLLGRFLNRHVAVLARYNIPQPISGGLAFAVIATVLHYVAGIDIGVSGAMRGPLLLAFFATVGLGADFGRLRAGGPKLALFLLVVVPFLIVQNATGTTLAILLDQHPLVGLIGGSVTMVGGHGTGAAYATILTETHNLVGASEMALAAATLGLVAGGVVAGPVAQFLMRRGRGGRTDGDLQAAARPAGPPPIGTDSAIVTLALIIFCLMVGTYLAVLAADWPLKLPDFIWCLFAGVLVRNVVAPVARKQVDDAAVDLLGGIALAMFLALTMSTLRLWELAALAGPLLVILVAQTAMTALYAIFVVYRMMGRDYEAVVMTAGFYGFAMGATATAIANMQAISNRYGPAPIAFLVVPLTGAFFIDLVNALVLTGALALPVFGE
ncbi:MAG: sodium/glutamate symporter [Alphaproteobacteria bacterium]